MRAHVRGQALHQRVTAPHQRAPRTDPSSFDAAAAAAAEVATPAGGRKRKEEASSVLASRRRTARHGGSGGSRAGVCASEPASTPSHLL